VTVVVMVDTSGPKLLDRVRACIRARHYSARTERAYVGWIKRFIVFHGKRHPREMGEPEVIAFLSSLATRDAVSASTQNLALVRSRKCRHCCDSCRAPSG
jgi:hypothetical protein